MNFKSYSAIALGLTGLLLAGMGVYFIFLRPPLLPEDLNYMGTTLQNVKNNTPGRFDWLQKVFWVMGGYIFTTGLLIIFIAMTSFGTRMNTAFIIIVIAGFTSIGLMTIVNFIIDSDFKLILLAFTLPWLLALILYRNKK